ncbi:MAG: UDP-glucose--hexose-1-phosphate uridylyltransferase [Clostridia bacterium]|nr:UDP-glucose--hexose-1-phosphate uridylyltransferase [Clostridia bacterium]
MIDGKILVEKLLKYAVKFLHLSPRDVIYYRNLLLREFKLGEPAEKVENIDYVESLDVPDELVDEIERFALENKLCEEGAQNLYSTFIMGVLSPLPSEVNRTFLEIKEKQGVEEACAYFYNLSVKNNYVQKTAIGRNLKWEYIDGDKFLEITINLSKPEKDNKEIAKLLTAPKSKKSNYPACFLCKENEGFEGTATHPARENIRTISLTLGGEPWFVQYSPYAYYNEHMIAISEAHVPMHIADDTIDKLLDFVDFFPNYMIGSNAALPIIGGSILNHEHFQGGEHLMPMHKAPLSKLLRGYKSKEFKKVKVGVVDWYNSVIRLESTNRNQIASLAKKIVLGWAKFSDTECGIKAQTDGVRHNSLAPVCRRQGKTYIFDMILRNNITSETYPDGVFHAHPEYHNIKKEGIGLIEAMGLFILPGRLKKQLGMIADILCGATEYKPEELEKQDNYLYAHRDMIKQLVSEGLAKDKAEAESRVTNYVNVVCKNILGNTSVFKKDEQGFKGFDRFLQSVGIAQTI